MSTPFTSDHTAAADALRDFYVRSHRTLDKLMAGEGASLARNKMLGHIERNSPVRAADLATAFGFAPRTITEAIDALERDGLVQRTGDISDSYLSMGSSQRSMLTRSTRLPRCWASSTCVWQSWKKPIAPRERQARRQRRASAAAAGNSTRGGSRAHC